jgi:ABC-type nitrate/sulfonate/bicarbonate transport system substrate-binding protein
MNIEGRLSRRRFLGGTGAAALGAAAGIACPGLVFAQNKKSIQFTLPWVAEGSNLFTFVAKGMGFWEKHGLDVEIARGSGSVAAAQAIGEGRFDFGMCTPSIAILQTIRGLPTVALAACAYDATMGIGVLNNGPIKTPKDLEGRTMASVVTPFFPAYAQKVRLDAKSIEFVHVDNKVLERVLMEKQVDAITSFALGSASAMLSKGVSSRWMLYSAAGIGNHGQTVATQRKTLETDPSLCEAISDGSARSARLYPEQSAGLAGAVPEGGAGNGAQPQLQGIRSHRARHVAARHRSSGGSRAPAGVIRPGCLHRDDRSRHALPDGARGQEARSRGHLYQPLCRQDQARRVRLDRCPRAGLRIRQVSQLTDAYP